MNNKVKYFTVDEEHSGQRLDNYLFKELKGVPKTHIYRIIRGGEVRVNKKRAKAMTRISAGDMIRIPPITIATPSLQYSKTDFSWFKPFIIFEDEALMVINKPVGLAVHGGSGVSLGVIELIRHLRPELKNLELVHRLDKETSGCLLISKKRAMLKELHQLLRDKKIEKVYWAMLSGTWQGKAIQIVDEPLKKYTTISGERVVKISEQGKPSQTHFKLLRNYQNCCLVEASPKTGRTHQIRVHATFLGHPIIGDEKYAGLVDKHGAKRLMLHAKSLKFNLADGKTYSFEATLDEQWQGFCDSLEL